MADIDQRDRAWREDPQLEKFWVADNLRTLFPLLHVGKTEHLPVHLTRARPEVGGYEGTLVSPAPSDATFTAGTRVTVRMTPGANEPVWLSPTAEKNLREWSARCTGCGFDLLIEPANELLRRQFPATPAGSVMEAFTTRCALCGETQMVHKRGSPQELIGGLHGATLDEARPADPASTERTNLWMTLLLTALAGAGLGLAAWWGYRG